METELSHYYYEFAGYPDTWATLDTRSTRNGFAHDAHVHGDAYGDATCHYLNRTWEAWTGQSAILAAIASDMFDERSHMLDMFKSSHGYQRMTEARRDEFEAALKTSEGATDYRRKSALYDMVAHSTTEYTGRNGYLVKPRD